MLGDTLLDPIKRITAAEEEVAAIRAELAKLQSKMSGADSAGLDPAHPAVVENQKLKYRLNILKRAASAMDSAPTYTAASTLLPADNTSMYSVLNVLTDLFTSAVHSAYPDLSDTPILVSLANPVLAAKQAIDYQCNSALPILRTLKERGVKTSPGEIGKKIASCLPPHAIVESCDVAPAGFVNVRISKEEARRLLQLNLDYGVKPPNITTKKQRVVIDFSSPNIAKEMHVGHLRSTIIGESISRLLEFLGHDVLRINHVGDWGTQFGMLIAHLQDKYPDYKQVSPSVSDLQAFYKESKKRFDEDEVFKKRAYACVVKLQGGEPDYIKAWQLICDASRKEFQKVYDRLGVTLIERGESFYQDRMERVVRELTEKNVLEEDEGRKIMWAKGVPVPFTVVKSDGGFTYDTSDLATIHQRLYEEHADWLIYVTDAGQSQHFEILRRCAEQLGWLPNTVRFDHVPFGVVLGEDKKKFKTRSGETVRLVDLLDEGLKRALEKQKEKGSDQGLTADELVAAQRSVAYGCIKYADLQHNRNHEYIFSFDKMLDDKGNTAVYLLYALTRIRSIARLAGVTTEQLLEASKTTQITLDHEKEWKLAKVLLRYGDVISSVVSSLCLHTLCEFVYEITCSFSEFYSNCYCVEKNDAGEIVKVNMGRLLLTEVTARLLEKCFYILGLEPVQKM